MSSDCGAAPDSPTEREREGNRGEERGRQEPGCCKRGWGGEVINKRCELEDTF